MRLFILLLLLFIIMGCAEPAAKMDPNKPWDCYADIDKNSVAQKIPCDGIKSVCVSGKYRIMKFYPTREVYVYSTDPLTDMDKFQKTIKEMK
jgi:hypothetical protein